MVQVHLREPGGGAVDIVIGAWLGRFAASVPACACDFSFLPNLPDRLRGPPWLIFTGFFLEVNNAKVNDE